MKGVNFWMPAQWTAEILGEMHLAGITAKQLAEEAGWHEKYLSAVMNGHRDPKGAEETLRAALGRIKSKSQ
jgi:lambda repressor-like predicted transcriptional regulator